VIKVLVPDIKRYESFLHETMFKLPGVTHVRSSVVLKEVKSETRLPLEAAGGRASGPLRRSGRK
jgi:DNA-binding Lrp family transcriptional regulator